MSRFFIFPIFILISISIFSQNEELNKQLEALQMKNYYAGLPIDSLCKVVGKTLVNRLEKTKILETAEIPLLERLESEDKRINIYTFKYYSGGSMGMNSNAVIQWTKPDGSFGSYELFPADKKGFEGVVANFYSIQKLDSDKDLYLLLGKEGYSGSMTGGIALVVRIKGDYLILDHPAFYKKSSALFFNDGKSNSEYGCVACMEYDDETQLLKVKNINQGDLISIRPKKKYIRIFRAKEPRELLFRFDGITFVKT